MRAAQPPRLADWLLERLASGPKRHALVGDLHEQYRRGRSATWYWRQALGAMFASTVRDIRHHQLFAARAVVMTYLLLIPWVFFTGLVYGSTRFWARAWLGSSVPLRDAWFLYQAPLVILWCLGSAMSGWLMARLHPHARAGMTVICALAQLPWAIQYGRPIWQLANAGLPFFQSFPVMVDVAFVFIVMPLSLVVGGLSAGLSERDQRAGCCGTEV